jgi:serine/threonine protein kinase
VHENLVLTREARPVPERNMYFAVRDYVNGVTLQKLLEGGKCFEPAQIVRILQQLVRALGAVHRRGMCHGGVKPSNIFVCEEDRVVLGDPALSVQGIGVPLERLSYDYRYAAPETFARGTVEPQSDFYSLGCVAYELVCGQPPFVSDNYHELAACHMHQAPAPPSSRGSRLRITGDEFLLKLVARSPAERYAKAEEILQALDLLEEDLESSIPYAEPPGELVGDASLARFQGSESVLLFDASAAALMSRPGDTLSSGSATPPPATEQPKRVGNYDIIETLGRGGMACVYKAIDRRLERVVALKVLLPFASGLAFDEQLARFQLEARAVARLQDPHIVQIHEIGEHVGHPYIALEYVAGGSLAQKLGTEGPLLPRAAAEIVAKLARAVHHAHTQGVLHRDLKPSNVLLTPDGQPKVADFGLAKIQELPKDAEPLTMSGAVMGTPYYMAPEQAMGETKIIGRATDIYGLGAILYALLTGRPPFEGKSIMGTLWEIATEWVVSPHTVNPAVSLELSTICLKCLEKEPQMRYSSAQELATDLERWLAGQPISARLPSRISRFMSWCRTTIAALRFPWHPIGPGATPTKPVSIPDPTDKA